MKFGRIAALTLGAVAALGITSGTIHAQPVAVAGPELAKSGVEQDVDYRTEVSARDKAVVTSVRHGRFAVIEDGAKVALTSDSGALVAEVPLAFEVSGARLPVAHEISGDGTRLALTPVADAKAVGEMQPITSMNRLIAEINKNIPGVVGGAVLGGLLGALLGVGFFSLLTGPIGLVVGGIAGGAVMGGQSFTDALMAVVNGEP